MKSPSKSPNSPSPRVNAATAEPTRFSRSSPDPRLVSAAADDACVNDVDTFARTIAAIKSRPAASSPGHDPLAAVLSHYAAKWLPDISSRSSSASGRFLPPESPTATWLKKRLLLESLVAALPPEHATDVCDDGVTCDFLLRLLRAGSMVGADAALLGDLEARAARRLEQASLGAVMIPAFGRGYACGTLLDVPLVLRLVRAFIGEAKAGGAAVARVARLVDAYLAEAALESGLRPAEFEELAHAVPAHARAADDAMYGAVDTYLKTHPNTSKAERRSLCALIDARKLSAEAAAHAVQNDRLPVRSVVQVLFSEHGKLHRLAEWSGSFRGLTRSPNPGLDLPGRCPSKREALAHHHELRRLREDVTRLQVQCNALQAQVDRLSLERRRRGFFKWGTFWFRGMGGADVARVEDFESGVGRRTPGSRWEKGGATVGTPGAATPTARWRKSLS